MKKIIALLVCCLCFASTGLSAKLFSFPTDMNINLSKKDTAKLKSDLQSERSEVRSKSSKISKHWWSDPDCCPEKGNDIFGRCRKHSYACACSIHDKKRCNWICPSCGKIHSRNCNPTW